MLFSPEKDVIGDGVASKIGAKWAQDYYQIMRILIEDAAEPAIQDLFQHAQRQLFGTAYTAHGLLEPAVTLYSSSVPTAHGNTSQYVLPCSK